MSVGRSRSSACCLAAERTTADSGHVGSMSRDSVHRCYRGSLKCASVDRYFLATIGGTLTDSLASYLGWIPLDPWSTKPKVTGSNPVGRVPVGLPERFASLGIFLERRFKDRRSSCFAWVRAPVYGVLLPFSSPLIPPQDESDLDPRLTVKRRCEPGRRCWRSGRLPRRRGKARG